MTSLHPFEEFIRVAREDAAQTVAASKGSNPYEDYREALRMGGTESACQALRATLAGTWLSRDPLDRDPYAFLHRLFRNVLGSAEHDVFRLSLLSLLESYESGEYECGPDTLHILLSLCTDSLMRKREPDTYQEVLRNALERARETEALGEATHILTAMADSRLFHDTREWLAWALEFGPAANLACFEGIAAISIARALLWLNSECPTVSRAAVLSIAIPALIGLKDDDTVEAALAAVGNQLDAALVHDIVRVLADHSGMEPDHHKRLIEVLSQQRAEEPSGDLQESTMSQEDALAELRASMKDQQAVDSIIRRRAKLLDLRIGILRDALLAQIPGAGGNESREAANA